jgi:regulator of protease activity HflC (stomatin/prohibitin superfamily)
MYTIRRQLYEKLRGGVTGLADSAAGVHIKFSKESEAVKQQQINEAVGEAQAILAVASATAEGLRRVAAALSVGGGLEAMQLRVAEDYLTQFGKLAKTANTLVVPANLSDIAGMIAAATRVFEHNQAQSGPQAPAIPR